MPRWSTSTRNGPRSACPNRIRTGSDAAGDAKMLELEELPFEQRREAIYGVAAD